MSPEPGWYPDPSGQTDLRWWDGQTWSAHTQALPPEIATASAFTAPGAQGVVARPAAPPGPPTFDPRELPTTPTPQVPGTELTGPVPPGPGSFGAWAPYSPSTPPAPGPSGRQTGLPSDSPDQQPRSWLPWLAVGGAIALAVVVVLLLAVALLGTSSTKYPSAAHTTTSTNGSSTTTPATTSPAPTTSTTLASVTGPTGSTLFTDPNGVYTMSVSPAWEPPSDTVSGIAMWYLTGINLVAPRSNLTIVSENLPGAMSLSDYVAAAQANITKVPSFALTGTQNITLADGSPAAVVGYQTEIGTQSIMGELVVTVKGVHAVVVTVTAGSAAAPSTFASVDPYVRTLHLN